MSDDIRTMTAELAANVGSLVFLELAEALRRRGQYEAAYKIARTGIIRYPELVAAYELCARIQVDQGRVEDAFESWADALRIDPENAGAHKGIGFLYHRAGDAARAVEHLERAAVADPGDRGIRTALARVRAALPAVPPMAEPLAAPIVAVVPPSLAPVLVVADADRPDRSPPPAAIGVPALPSAAATPDGFPDIGDATLLADVNGLRLGGGIRSGCGEDVSDAVAAQLGGVAREAGRMARLLALGAWQSVSAESAEGNLHLLAPTEDTILLTLRPPGVPTARLAIVSERAAAAARIWLERIG